MYSLNHTRLASTQVRTYLVISLLAFVITSGRYFVRIPSFL